MSPSENPFKYTLQVRRTNHYSSDPPLWYTAVSSYKRRI